MPRGIGSTWRTQGISKPITLVRPAFLTDAGGNGERLLGDVRPICTGLADYPQIFHIQLESHPRTSKLVRDFPKASIALDQRDSHAPSAFKTRNPVHSKPGIK